MIKTGDKVICIDDVDYYEQSLKKGSIYTIILYEGNGYEFYENGDLDKNPIIFPLRLIFTSRNCREELIFDKIRNYIMILAEWREKQMKTILDD